MPGTMQAVSGVRASMNPFSAARGPKPPTSRLAGDPLPRSYPEAVISTLSAGVLDRAGFPDHGDFDLPGILELLLDLSRYLVREQRGRVVVDRARGDHHADLSPGLHRVHLVDAFVAGGDLLAVAPPLVVLL